MAQGRAVSDQAVNSIFEKTRVCEIKTFVDPKGQHCIRRHDAVALYVAEMLRTRHLSDNRKMRAACVIEVEEKRQRNASDDAKLNARRQCYDNRRRHGGEIVP